jgi:hypothetical protein
MEHLLSILQTAYRRLELVCAKRHSPGAVGRCSEHPASSQDCYYYRKS